MNDRLVSALLLLAALGLALALAGCDEDDAGCRPEIPAGRIAGRVYSGGLLLDGEVRATRLPEGQHLESEFETALDASGRYSLDVPAGRYILTLVLGGWEQTRYDYAAAGLNYGQSKPDTLDVDYEASPLRVDFLLGGLAVDVGLSPVLDGERGEVLIYPRTLAPSGEWRTHVFRGSAEIGGGRLYVQVPGILPDQYRVEVVLGIRRYMCYCPFDGEHVWYPGVRDSSAAAWISIGADSLQSLGIELPDEPARIEGRVSGAWLEMGSVYEPEVSLFTPDSMIIMGPRIVDSEGDFAWDFHFAGPVKLRVTQDGVEQWIGGPAFEDATTYDLQLGETISGIELQQCGLRFVGEPETSSGFLEIRFYDPGNLELLATRRARIAPSFPRSVSNLWPGEFLMYLTYSRPGGTIWPPQWYDQATDPTEAQIIVISTPGEVVDIPLVLARGGALRGTVQPSSPDSGYNSWYVIVTPAMEADPWGYDYTSDRHPEFELLGLPDGEYKVGAYPVDASPDWIWPQSPPAGMFWYPDSSTWEEAAALAIIEADQLDGLELLGDVRGGTSP